MPIKDAIEMLVKIFNSQGTQFVKDAADIHAIIGMGVICIFGGDQHTVITLAERIQVRRVVMAIPQDETDFGKNLAQQRTVDRSPLSEALGLVWWEAGASANHPSDGPTCQV